jgi:hypothetical protein
VLHVGGFWLVVKLQKKLIVIDWLVIMLIEGLNAFHIRGFQLFFRFQLFILTEFFGESSSRHPELSEPNMFLTVRIFTIPLFLSLNLNCSSKSGRLLT